MKNKDYSLNKNIITNKGQFNIGKNELWILFLFLINNRFCYLIPIDLNISGFKFDDLSFFFLAFLIVISFIKDGWFDDYNFNFNKIILFGVIVFAISILTAYLNYQQPIILGIIALRRIIVWLLMYFYFRSFVRKHKISTRKLINIIYIYGILLLFVSSIQYLLPNNLFVDVGQRERFNEYAYFYNYSNIVMLFTISLYKFQIKRSVFELIITLWCIFFVIFILKVRALSIGILLVIAIYLFFYIITYRKSNFILKLVYLFSFSIGLVYFVNSSMGVDLYYNLTKSKDANLEIREVGRVFYLSKIVNYPFFGIGYPNPNWENAAKISGIDDGIAMSDNGLFGTTAYYGVISLIWTLIIFVVSFVKSWRFYIKTKNYMFFGYLLINLFCSITLPPDIFNSVIGFQIFFVLIELYSNQINNQPHKVLQKKNN